MPEGIMQLWPILGPFVSLAAAGFVGWVGWSVTKKFATKEDLSAEAEKRGQAIDGERKSRHEREGELRQLLADGMRRVDRIEADMEHLPTAEAVAALTVQMTRVEGRLAAFDERVDGFAALMNRMDRQVQVMDEFLRKVQIGKVA